MQQMPTQSVLQGQSLPSLCPPLTGYVEEMGAPAVHKEVLFDHAGAQGGISKGGNKSGKVCPEVPSSPKADYPGRLRLAALEAGFSSFKTEIASMFASLTGRFTASHPPDSNTDGSRLQAGVACGGVIPSQELADPPASQRRLKAPLDSTAIPWTPSMAVNGATAQLTSLSLPSKALL